MWTDPYPFLNPVKNGWGVYIVYHNRTFDEERCRHVPRTCNLAKRLLPATELPFFHIYNEEAGFFRMSPGAIIAPHSGPVNTIINTHVGLRGVEGARFFVNGTEVRWREGQTFSFEDSFEHWGNHAPTAPETRIIFMIRQMHPDVRREHFTGHSRTQAVRLRDGDTARTVPRRTQVERGYENVSMRSECAGLGSWEPASKESPFVQNLGNMLDIELPSVAHPVFDWEWASSSCSLYNNRPITRQAACRILRSARRVLFVGDSVQGQFATSFVSLLGARTKWHEPTAPFDRLDDEWAVCGTELERSVEVAFMRDDFLWSRFDRSYPRKAWVFKTKEARHRVTNWDWLQSPDLFNASKDIVVFNAGPHYHNETSLRNNITDLARKFKVHMKEVAGSNVFPIIFRYSVGGHPKCDKSRGPITQREFDAMWNAIRASPAKKAHFMDKYAWHLQPRFNSIIVKAFQRHHISIVKFDVETPSRFRKDAHPPGDCLHWKMPGLMDMWAMWMLDILDTAGEGNQNQKIEGKPPALHAPRLLGS